MKLFCKTCGEAIPAHDINIELAIAKCGRCHTVFKFLDELEDSARGAPAKPVEIEMPRGLAVDEWGSELTIVRRWFTPALFFLVFFCCIWDGFLIVWYSIALSSMPGDMAWLALLFPLLHVAVGVGLTYYTICGFVNRTTVHVASGELRVSHRPLPWPGARRIAVLDLDQLFCSEHISRGKNGTSVTYRLNALLRDGSKVSLLSSIEEPLQVLFLEQKIENFLQIADRYVPGEMRKI